MIRYLAEWVVPVGSPPIKQGYVDVVDGLVGAVGRWSDATSVSKRDRVIELRAQIVCPALVNAHTHLELSDLRGKVGPVSRMPDWAQEVVSCASEAISHTGSIQSAIEESHKSGTGLVGDIANSLASIDALCDSAIDGVVFKELLGFDVGQSESLDLVRDVCNDLASQRTRRDVRLALAAHAPYSVSPALFRAIRSQADHARPLSVHLAESGEELEFLRTGTGAWRDMLESRGRWDGTWQPFGDGPMAYLEQWGWIASNTLVVHGVHLTDAELQRLARAGATLVTCPRSNQWTGAGRPPVDRFYGCGARVAIGTDSLASTPDLNVFSEMAELRRLAPELPASSIVESATRVGARALGFSDRGSITAGKLARLIAVRRAGTVDDVEEYLVSGIEPDQVAWLE